MENSPIGLVGVGLLGTALAERMLAGGFAVHGFDLNPSQSERLRQFGGVAATAVTDLTHPCNRIVLCLPDSNIAASVVDQLGHGLRSGTLLIDATTGDPDVVAALAGRLQDRGIGYVDATIVGSSEQVRQGHATAFLSGVDEHIQRATPVVATWTPRLKKVPGGAGSATRLKLIVNLVLGLNRAVLAEGLSLAKACGMDAAFALEALKITSAYSKVMETKGDKMAARDYTPQARLAQHLKDVRLIRELANRHAARTPLTAIHEDLLKRAIELGFGDADNSAIIEALSQ
jgi:3-hydroxyisobutyrate dehydrogenase-like beta-hydroxyacid dehydrogenase